MDTARGLAFEFIARYFEQRDVEGTLSLLTEDVQYMGTTSAARVRDRVAAALYMRQRVVQHPLPFYVNIRDVTDISQCRECGVAFLELEIRDASVAFVCRLTVTSRMENGVCRICALHISALPSLSTEGKPLPHREILDLKAQLDLYRSFNSGGVFVVDTDADWTLLYANDRYFEYHEESPVDVLHRLRNRTRAFVHPDDLPRVEALVQDALAKGAMRLDMEMRIVTVRGTVKDIHCSTEVRQWHGRKAFCGVIIDQSAEKRIRRSLEEAQLQLNAALADAKVSVWEYDIPGKRIIQTGSSMQTHGFDVHVVNVPQSLVDCGYVLPESQEDFLALYREVVAGRSATRDVLVHGKDGTETWWERITYTLVPEADGRCLRAIGTSFDVSHEKALAAAHRQIEMLLKNVHGGVCAFEVCGRNISVTYFNEGMCGLWGMNTQAYSALARKDPLRPVHPDDIEGIYQTFAACTGDAQRACVFRVRHTQGHLVWIKLNAVLMEQKDDVLIFYGFFTDISGEKAAAERLLLNEETVRIAVAQTGITFWTLDIPGRRILEIPTPGLAFGLPKTIENIPESLLGIGVVHPDDEQTVREIYAQIYGGVPSVSAVLRVKKPSASEYRWTKTLYTVLFDEDGSPKTAIGSSMDITEQKILEARFNEEMSDMLRTGQHEDTRSFFRFNVTRDRVEEFTSRCPDVVAAVAQTASMTGLFKYAIAKVSHKGDKIAMAKIFDRKALLASYVAGNTEFSIECMYAGERSDGLQWLRMLIKTIRHPTSGDIIAFAHTHDITRKRMVQSIMNGVVELHYDFVCCIDASHNSFMTIASADALTPMFPRSGDNYQNSMDEFAAVVVPAPRREEFLRANSLDVVLAALEQRPTYENTVCITLRDGSMATKRVQYSYLDRDHPLVLLAQTDITNIIIEEERKKRELGKALDAAQQASIAKSEFLSRMSHEIRTPINAIIGMTAIASQSLDDARQVSNCVEKIGTSSRFLLGIINDILDMSRIESGKFLLKKERIAFYTFLQGITAICGSLMEGKGIHFGIHVSPVVSACYMGDTMKLQQVIVNVLSNAAKFTPYGGKVSLAVTCLPGREDMAQLRFIIKDNGCGMSEGFLPHVFEPFAQEHTGTTSLYGGTGLGLAISNNLVELMDGHIRVKSAPGKGSCFIVDVLLGMPTGDATPVEQKTEALPENFSFAGYRVLLAEDHPINVEVASIILSTRGFAVEVAENGRRALEMYLQKPCGYYNAVLMDMRMPVMDGLEATRLIRACGRDDAQSIPIIALTANAFGEDIMLCVDAGMQGHLAKPIDPALLYQTLYDAIKRAPRREH